jgi:NAD-dependent dihydropyrimidine dehydrogenase PreA subunit
MPAEIDPLKCTGCGNCTFLCSAGVLAIDDLKCRVYDGNSDCGVCLDACPFQAIKLE